MKNMSLRLFSILVFFPIVLFAQDIITVRTPGDSIIFRKLPSASVVLVEEEDTISSDSIDVATGVEMVEGDEMIIPGEDYYGEIWDNKKVNYAGYKLEIPDTCTIDVSAMGMPLAQIRMTSRYGWRWGRMHGGVDLGLSIGDTVRAAADGRVRLKYYQQQGYGYYMVLRHPNGLETVYGHLYSFLVNLNEDVKAGQPIALGGNSGRSTGAHLHFETRFLGITIDPEDIYNFKQNCIRRDKLRLSTN